MRHVPLGVPSYSCGHFVRTLMARQRSQDDLLAHAYVLVVPRMTLSKNLSEGMEIDVPVSRVNPAGSGPLPVMVLDGTNLKTVEEWPAHFKTGNPSGNFNAFRRATDEMTLIEQAGDRLKAYNDQDSGYYINVSSLLTSSLLVKGSKVYHVYPYNTRRERFGCSFEDVCEELGRPFLSDVHADIGGASRVRRGDEPPAANSRSRLLRECARRLHATCEEFVPRHNGN